MMKGALYLLVFLLFLQCSPARYYEKGNYKKSFQVAARQIEKGKNILENKFILEASANEWVDDVLYQYKRYIQSDEVGHWIKAQTEYYKVLSHLGENGQNHTDIVGEAYNLLCEEKLEIDLKIVTYFYEEGVRLLDESILSGEKRKAREAYYSLKDCKKYGGDLYFSDISTLMDEAVSRGRVYFQADGININESLFFVETNDHNIVDCYISTDWGSVIFDEIVDEVSRKYKKEIIVGHTSVTDTSGTVTKVPIYKEVKGTVTKRTVTLIGTLHLKVHSEDVSGQCSYGSWYTEAVVEDSYEEVDLTGDSRAYPSHLSSKSGKPAFFRSGIIDDLYSEIESKIKYHSI